MELKISNRTDLAMEGLNNCKELKKQDFSKKEQMKNGVQIIDVEVISEYAQTELGKPKGRYVTLHLTDFKTYTPNFNDEVEVVAQTISEYTKGSESVLVVGLGNREITPDALGPTMVKYTLPTRHISEELARAIALDKQCNVSCIATGVLGQTGMEAVEVIQGLVEQITPELVIVVDALATMSVERLGNTIQICDSGIAPGSGVANNRPRICQEVLGCRVVSIGVPMVVEATEVMESEQATKMMVTPREIDVVIERASKMIGYAINRALHPQLELSTIVELVGV